MTIERVNEILRRQEDDHRFFGEFAADLGFVSREKLGMFLAAAKRSHEGGTEG